MKKPFSSLLLIFSFGAGLFAAPLERDLSRGLIYHRAPNVPADLPATNPAEKRSRVLDLRYAQGNDDGATALIAWLRTNATTRTPVFLLANAETNPALLAPFARQNAVEGVLTVGPSSARFNPDIAVKVSPEIERRAYDAIEAQTEIESLLKENSDKLRNDEARLAKERQPDPALLDDAGTPGEKNPVAKPPAPLIDLTLQRAMQLHRGLQALKKI
ncbi:MAG TPA: hypothetical protein VHO24_17265 [Opitutaceae bacterium]|nr:hypothetical protein [Opitutaceae bacterium]